MSYTTYTKVGPFTNGAAPGINKTFLDGLETFCAAGWFDSAFTSDGAGNLTAISFTTQFNKLNPTGVVLNGATSGTATLYQPQRGTWKVIMIALSNFRNTSGSAQTITFPQAFTTAFYIRTTALFNISFNLATAAQTLSIITALASGGGSIATSTSVSASSFALCPTGADTISFNSGGTGGVTGVILLEGV